jgi:hypothetical protein
VADAIVAPGRWVPVTAGIVAAGVTSICIDNVRDISRDSGRNANLGPPATSSSGHRRQRLADLRTTIQFIALQQAIHKAHTTHEAIVGRQALADAVVMATLSLSV